MDTSKGGRALVDGEGKKTTKTGNTRRQTRKNFKGYPYNLIGILLQVTFQPAKAMTYCFQESVDQA